MSHAAEEPSTGWRLAPAELWWALAWAAALAALTTLPYVIAAGATPSARHYLGFVFNPDEPNVHLSWIRQAAEGAVFFRNEFTAEPHVGRFLNIFMLFAGRLASWLHLSAYQIWAVGRAVAPLLLGVACYLLASDLSQHRRSRRLAVVIITLSSGLGWAWLGTGDHPFSRLFNPLVALAVVLLTMGVAWGELALRDGDRLAAGGAVVVALLLHHIPRTEPLLLVAALLLYLLVLYLNGETVGREQAVVVALVALAAAPPLFRLHLGWAGAALVLAGLLGYLRVLLTARRREAAWLRFGALALAALAGWAASTQLGLDPIDVEPDLVMPEAITFLSLYLNPLFTASMALLVFALVFGERAIRQGHLGFAAAAGVCGLLLANMHTYDAIPLLGVLTLWLAWLLWQRGWHPERLAAWALILLLVLPAVGYQAWLIASEPLYQAKATTPTPTPPPVTMLLSYGWLVPLALYGAMTLLRRGHGPVRFWLIWLLFHTLCLYLPLRWFPFQRKMIEGLHVVLALLAAAGLLALCQVAAARLAWLVSWPAYREHGAAWAIRADAACRRNGYLRPLAILGAALLMPSNLLFVQHSLAQVTSDSQTKVLAALMPPFYLPEAEWKAFDWMRQKLPREAVVGCLPLAGSYLPGRIGRTVYCGHWAETIDFPKKVSALTWFYRDPASAKEKVGFLREAGITHVYFGAYELQLARGQLPRMPALKLVYPARLPAPPELPPVAIYQVLPAEGE